MRRGVVGTRAANPRGFTLVEVLVALGLVVFVLVPVMTSLVGLLGDRARSEGKREALEFARSAIEAARNLGPDSFAEGRTITTVTGPSGQTLYDVEKTLAVRDEHPLDPAVRLWEIGVAVYRSPRQVGAPALCSLETLIRAE